MDQAAVSRPTVRPARSGSVLVAALLLATAACQPPTPEPEIEFRASVGAESVDRGRVERVLTTTGTVRARHEAKILAETAGKLRVAIHPDTGERLAVGDVVREGQLVAHVEDEERRLSARVGPRKQALDAAQSSYDRSLKLFEDGLLSDEKLEEARTKLESARGDYRYALEQEAQGRLESPLDGVVTKVTTAADGEHVGATEVLAEIMSFDEVIVDLDLGSGEVLDVQPGLPTRIQHYAAEDVFEGTIRRVSPAIDPVSRTFRVEVLVPNPRRRLRPGMFVRAEIVLESKEDVVVVPTAAIVDRDGRTSVFVVEAQRVHLREVELGLVDPEHAEILKGVAVGERVVVSGQDTLQDGARVIVRG